MSADYDATAPQRAVQTYRIESPAWEQASPRRPRRPRGWWVPSVLLGAAVGLVVGLYLLWPSRTNVLLLGIDRRLGESVVSRTDTIILSTFEPLQPYVGLLSIPRDLWVTLPNGSQNRINTAHFFAEAASPGSGPLAAKRVVAQNFGVTVNAYVRLDFVGLRDFVDALGGVEVDLPQPMSGYSAGRHRLNGEQALAFVRDRAGSDDFAGMARGQIFIRGVLAQSASPSAWPRLPLAVGVLAQSLDSDVPVWLWPRLGFTLLRVGAEGIDGRVITRTKAHGFTTQAGAQVLAPDWPRINPVLMDMFDQ
jgi:LCP family protein required for cell wall assembly